ncbi:MAG: agmatine deiminase family protein [Verrucomicrobia bacterium]|nr:agmatine deiminase family protein [Verrucomicrobiota bacterium]
MITDSQTNFLYLADTLQKKYPNFYRQFEAVLNDCDINFKILPQTKDVWAVDYMPIQITKDSFVQFVYNPDYLRDTVKWSKTISDVDTICNQINLLPQKSTIVLDGGNVTRTTDKVIMCDKVFAENPAIKEKDLIKELQELFRVDKLIFIPTHPIDFTGHADGMVRFYDSNTVLINDYSKENIEFQLRFRLALHNAGLNYIEIPYNPYDNKKDEHANGEYINFLQMQQAIIIPTFGMKEDDTVIKQFEQLFTGQRIATVDGNDLAFDGGILNCITWNIYK